MSDERKKIAERLSNEGKATEGFDPATLTVVRRVQKIGGVSGTLAHLPFLRRHRPQDLAGLAQLLAGEILLPHPRLPRSWASRIMFVVTASVLLGSVGAVVFGIARIACSQLSGQSPAAKTFMDQLPEALDYLSRILRAGHSLSTGLQMMADELPQPLSGEFRRCYDSHSVGQALEDALKDTAIRVDNPDFGFFVTAILIQRQTGGDLSEVLTNISDMIRQRIRLQQHVKAKTAEGRFTGYILVVFPVVLFFVSYYLNPKYASVLLHTSTGLWLLALAAAMLMLGTWAIKKITTIKV